MRSPLHPWDLSPGEAIALQLSLRGRVITHDDLREVRRVAGVDVSYDRGRGISFAAVAVLSFPELELTEKSYAALETTFPYVPGLLSFRESPVALKALHSLTQAPDLLLCDGHGYAHPRRFGLACHLGLWLDIPCIGVAKRRLVGEHAPVGESRGSWEPLQENGEVIGAALRTRASAHPVYVSIGHRVGLATAVHTVLACCTSYRLPEPNRWAHRLAAGRRRILQ